MSDRRVTLFCGHYGSGKTNISVNYALYLKNNGKEVDIADMDIVNPYFRTKDSEELLNTAGIRLISPRFANSNVDLPALPQELYGLFERRERCAVLDIGGDDRGAYALGRFTPFILEENDYNNLYVVNFYRPLTMTAADAFEVMKEIEAAGRIPFTGIVNNSNLGEETAAETVEKSAAAAAELSALSGVPVVMTSVKSDIAGDVRLENVFPLRLQAKYYS
ncbi:MAG: hypothetical protein K6F64_00885 [Clostridia bacterium]|nr:hypothetical protein [Clostridia bacterium]